MAYPKFRLSPADRMALLEDYLPNADIVPLHDPHPEIPHALRDHDDVVFVRLAMTAGAPLITGDSDFAAVRSFATVQVLSVTELREMVG